MTRILLSLALATALAGCATDYPQVDAAFGKSQAQMIRAQTLDPQAATHPPALAPERADGQRLENVLAQHRKDVPEQATKQVSQSTKFDAGSGQ